MTCPPIMAKTRNKRVEISPQIGRLAMITQSPTIYVMANQLIGQNVNRESFPHPSKITIPSGRSTTAGHASLHISNTTAQAKLAQICKTWKLVETFTHYLTRVNLIPIVGGWWPLTHSDATLQRFPSLLTVGFQGGTIMFCTMASCNTEFCIKVKSKIGLTLLYILC